MEFQSVMLSNSTVVAGPLMTKSVAVAHNSGDMSKIGLNKEIVARNSNDFVGILDIYIHQARDIHNICIYQKQDVYAKLYLTSDPKTTVSTQIINGGGKNPVFNENLRLNVRTFDSSLKCEIWMLSRVRNYLEDQVLGFALVPLADVLVESGKLGQEFPLSTSDLFHSPAGFVQLTLDYSGASPEVFEIPRLRPSAPKNAAEQVEEVSDLIRCELVNIEFPDPKIDEENEMMVSECLESQCTTVDSQSSESVGNVIIDNGIRVFDNLPTPDHNNVVSSTKLENTPDASISSNGSPSVSVDTPAASESVNLDASLSLKEKTEDDTSVENGFATVHSTFAQPVISINVEPDQKVVQQDIVDMYMKSMQQFTEAFAKKKLALDIIDGRGNSANSESGKKVQVSKYNSPGAKVFYGSRAFF